MQPHPFAPHSYWSNDDRWTAVTAEQRDAFFAERFGAQAAAAAARKEVG